MSLAFFATAGAGEVGTELAATGTTAGPVGAAVAGAGLGAGGGAGMETGSGRVAVCAAGKFAPAVWLESKGICEHAAVSAQAPIANRRMSFFFKCLSPPVHNIQ